MSVIGPVRDPIASQKLSPSRLSDQLETLNSDVDLASLNLADGGGVEYKLLSSVTAATIERTIEGASTLTIIVRDYDRRLLQSGYIGIGLDCEIDGLWFRLWAWQKSGDDLTLTFIDREVAVLKQWPPTSEGAKMYRVWNADRFDVKTRFKFAEQLIADVASVLPIRFVCPAIGAQVPVATDADKAANKAHGFPANVKITVKGAPASPVQISNLEAVLETGDAAGARTKVLIAAVAVVTQESDAKTGATNGPHVGLFQQDAADGWPATRDPAADATAFFEAAISDDQQNPNLPIAQLGDDVQLSGHPELYQQWVTEATATVNAYLGNTDLSLAGSTSVQLTSIHDPTAGLFMRGRLDSPSAAARKRKQVIVATTVGNKVVVREDNWACLTRLASEIGYRCFCVSGTVYFIDDYTLYHQRVAMTFDEAAVGVDSIDADYTQGKLQATLTVKCRADRWQCPPGGVAAVTDMGPGDGRWLCSDVQRSLFDPAATITLKKPLDAIPESDAPEHGTGAASGVAILTPSGNKWSPSPGESSARQKIAAVAAQAIALQTNSTGRRYHYLQRRPMPAGLFSDNPEYIDCSAFATLCYKAAGAPDPNGAGYDGSGDTGTLVAHALSTIVAVTPGASSTGVVPPQPGDLVFYGGTASFPEHVAVYMGDGQIANMGSEGDPVLLDMNDPGLPKPLWFIRSFDLVPKITTPHGTG